MIYGMVNVIKTCEKTIVFIGIFTDNKMALS